MIFECYCVFLVEDDDDDKNGGVGGTVGDNNTHCHPIGFRDMIPKFDLPASHQSCKKLKKPEISRCHETRRNGTYENHTNHKTYIMRESHEL